MIEPLSIVVLLILKRSNKIVIIIIIIPFISAILQVSSIAVFGGCALASYNAKSITVKDILNSAEVFYGWTYWLTIPGVICTLIAATLFLVTDCWAGRDKI